MPQRPPRPCAQPGCPRLVERGYCNGHRRPDDRASARERGYDSRWERASKAFLRAHPLCYYCDLRGITTAGECVDHATPHRGGDDPLFWDVDNWRSACIRCNSTKGDRTEAEFVRAIGAKTF